MKNEQNQRKTTLSYAKSWSKSDTVNYFSAQRSSVDKLYASEKYILSKVLEPGNSILDIGCATGGFCNIFKQLEPSVTYTGIDISSEMINTARTLHPDSRFYISQSNKLPFGDQSFDLVFCSGVLHMTFDWRDLLMEGWRVTKKYFIFDVRLVKNLPSLESLEKSYQKMAFGNEWDGMSVVPYIILNIKDFLDYINRLNPKPDTQHYYGYYHPVSPMTVTELEYNEVCMTMCKFGKIQSCGKKNIWGLPISKPHTR